MKKIIAGAIVGGAIVVGISVGAGDASAKIEPGQYKMTQHAYGVVPTPPSNAKVVGNKMYTDDFGVGPRNMFTYHITPTKNGGHIASAPGGPVISWLNHAEVRKTNNGVYRGTNYILGQIPTGSVELKKVPGRR